MNVYANFAFKDDVGGCHGMYKTFKPGSSVFDENNVINGLSVDLKRFGG